MGARYTSVQAYSELLPHRFVEVGGRGAEIMRAVQKNPQRKSRWTRKMKIKLSHPFYSKPMTLTLDNTNK